LELAHKITEVLDCLNLTSLERFVIEERQSFLDEPDEQPWKPDVVDHYIEWMTTTDSIKFPERVSSIILDCFGNDPEVWPPFVARFSSIQEVWLGLREGAWRNPNASRHAEALALSTRQLPQLRNFGIFVRATGLSSIVSCFMRELVPLPTLAEFYVSVGKSDNGSHLSELALDDVYKYIASSTSLKDVTLHVDEDFTVLYDLLAKNNVTLQRIKFRKQVRDADTKARIEWLLTLNRYNRRCLLPPHAVEEMVRIPTEGKGAVPWGGQVVGPAMAPFPAGAWPLVLGPISTDNRADVMYHFLGKMPKSLLLLRSPPPPGRGLKRAAPPSDRDPNDE
jgi:hypothetical protein